MGRIAITPSSHPGPRVAERGGFWYNELMLVPMGSTDNRVRVQMEWAGETEANRAYVEEFLGYFDELSQLQIRKTFHDLSSNLDAINHLHAHVGNLELQFLTLRSLSDPEDSILSVRNKLENLLVSPRAENKLSQLLAQRKLLIQRLSLHLIRGPVRRAIRQFSSKHKCQEGTNFRLLTVLRVGLQRDPQAEEIFSKDGVQLLANLLNVKAKEMIHRNKEAIRKALPNSKPPSFLDV